LIYHTHRGGVNVNLEAAPCNLIEPGDRVVVRANGLFAERMCDIMACCQGEPSYVWAKRGRIIEPEQDVWRAEEYRASPGVSLTAARKHMGKLILIRGEHL